MKIALLCSRISQNNTIFLKTGENEVTYQGGYLELKKLLNEQGADFQTIDNFKNLHEIDVAIIDFTLTAAIHELLQLIKANPKVRVLYYMHEPETAVPLNNKLVLRFLGIFDAVLTLRDQLIDDKLFFKILPAQRPLTNQIIQNKHKQKEGICLINTFVKRPRFQKLFSNLNELYTERIKAIRLFKDYPGFTLFGKRWAKFEDQNLIKSIFKGPVDNKIQTMSNFKFSICFESQVEDGYISEKVFDSLFAFCVPIYRGAKNISDLIPKNCYINYDDFDTLEGLKNYIDHLTKDEYQKYLNNIEDYLQSDLYAKNSSAEFAKTLLRHIQDKRPAKNKSFFLLKIRMILLAILQPKRVYNKKQRRFLYDTLFFW